MEIAQVGLPLVTEAYRNLQIVAQRDLVLRKRIERIEPEQAAPNPLLHGELVRGAVLEVGDGVEVEGAEAVGAIVDGTAAELQRIADPEADVVVLVRPTDDIGDVQRILGARATCCWAPPAVKDPCT